MIIDADSPMCPTCKSIDCNCYGPRILKQTTQETWPTNNLPTFKAERKYLPTLSELIDRLSILQIKEVKIPEYKEEYAKEIQDILHDIDHILYKENATSKEEIAKITANTIRDIIVLAQYNLHIWQNETLARQGKDVGENLKLTHSLNGIRNEAKNRIQAIIGGRKDYKVDCLAADAAHWKPSW